MIALRYRIAGRAMRLYTRVMRPRTFGVRALLLDPGGRVALVRHHYIAGWYLPGGGVNRGEHAEAAIRRELHEEIGLTQIEITGLLGIYHNRAEAKDDHVVVFVATAPPGVIPTAADCREIAEAGWFAPDALPEDTSPATRRRIAEHLTGQQGHGAW
ncbi:MAG: NUDIX domain-containing protein [Candidatus Sphingomonas colombiensis]|nr:NUDIX domain-containing protein [Sphingomonas sp.]WEK41979.1 MAG: NUDIX domain-containing protein [Sphingomonas sp.]